MPHRTGRLTSDVLDPATLFQLAPDAPLLDRPVLVHALSGFVDAGGATRLARQHLLGRLESRVVATFDVDQLHDYRARRPPMLFVEDHWESYDDPKLVVHLVTDAVGVPFLLLDGPEPDVQWERFVAAVGLLVAQFGVRLTVGLNSIPMAVPHTRPIGVTAHASRRELIPDNRPWINTVQVPASAGHLIEYRLGRAGHDTAGFAVHVPQYVAAMDYPAAAVALIDAVAGLAGLVLPTDELAVAATETRSSIDEQVGASDEVTAVVKGLEQQYDLYVHNRDNDLLSSPDGTLADAELPSADELGAELERFLAEQVRRDRRDE